MALVHSEFWDSNQHLCRSNQACDLLHVWEPLQPGRLPVLSHKVSGSSWQDGFHVDIKIPQTSTLGKCKTLSAIAFIYLNRLSTRALGRRYTSSTHTLSLWHLMRSPHIQCLKLSVQGSSGRRKGELLLPLPHPPIQDWWINGITSSPYTDVLVIPYKRGQWTSTFSDCKLFCLTLT